MLGKVFQLVFPSSIRANSSNESGGKTDFQPLIPFKKL